MYKNENEFISSLIPAGDSNYAIKRMRFEEWYKFFGREVFTGKKLSDIAQSFGTISHDKYWIHNENGDVFLNRTEVIRRILTLKALDNKNEYLISDYYRYQSVCWLCLERNIREVFPFLEKYKKDSHSEGKFITERLSGCSRIKTFWSHYIHVIDKDGEYTTNPEISSNLCELMRKYELDFNNKIDIWKYGFECAKEEGCIEALEFFFRKLKESKIDEGELDAILVNTALYASSKTYSTLIHSNAEVISFCLDNLRREEHEMLMCRERIDHVLARLEEAYLFGYEQELINCRGSSNLSHTFYSGTIYRVIDQVGRESGKELRQKGVNFLMWMLNEDNFLRHKNSFLKEINDNNPWVIRILSALIMLGEVEPFAKILDYVEGKKLRKIVKLFEERITVCCSLYIQGRYEVLSKIFVSNERSKKFFEGMDELMNQHPDLKNELHAAYESGSVEEIESVFFNNELLDSLSVNDVIDRKLNKDEVLYQDIDVLYTLNDLTLDHLISNNQSR
ncbi:hypothetical protein [Wolbachia endosymbiont of Tetranychus urticae]|uniref:hypothetical protein n=1 Tax=Wolbachia endosymbiont of Tetranychus urticae TaxID=169184 RepID=UPI00397AD8D9